MGPVDVDSVYIETTASGRPLTRAGDLPRENSIPRNFSDQHRADAWPLGKPKPLQETIVKSRKEASTRPAWTSPASQLRLTETPGEGAD